MKLNKKSFKALRIGFAVLLSIILLLPAFPQKAFAAGGPTYSGISMDKTSLSQGQICHINGKVSSGSGYNLNYVEAVVYNRSTGKRVTSSGESGIGKSSYSIRSSKVDNDLKFGKLAIGNYYLVINAQDTKGNSSSSSRIYFTVSNPIQITDFKVANKTITMGNACDISGKITSSNTITKVKVTLSYFNAAKAQYTNVQSHEYNPNTKSITIASSPINKNIKFGQADPGKYVLCLEVWDSSGAFEDTSVSGITVTGLKVAASIPSSIQKGKACNITGSITTNGSITTAYGRIVNKNGKTLYTSPKITSNGSTIIDIKTSRINLDLPFGKLDKGSYKLVVYAKDSLGREKTQTISFTVK